MNDTPPKITAMMQEMIQKKSPLERLLMASSSYQLSKQIVISSILKDYPDISQKDLRRKIFERYYSCDFTPIQLEKILIHLDAHVPNEKIF